MDKDHKKQNENWTDKMRQIREQEAPYKEGAWEAFEAKYLGSKAQLSEPNGTPVVPLFGKSGRVSGIFTMKRMWISSAAAVVLLSVGLVWLWPTHDAVEDPLWVNELNSNPSEAGGTVVEEVLSVKEEENSFQTLHSSDHFATLTSSKGTDQQNPILSTPTKLSQIRDQKAEILKITTPDQQLSSINQPTLENAILFAVHQQDKKVSTATSENDNIIRSFFGRFDRGHVLASSAGGHHVLGNGKWALGLSLASMLTSEDMNLGGGLSVAYKLTDRVYFRSGVSLAKLGVSTPAPGSRGPSLFVRSDGTSNLPGGPQGPNPGNIGNKESIAVISPEGVPGHYNRILSGASSTILTLDIPFDVKYFVSDKVFTSVGVSFLGVLREQRTNHYIDKINEPLFNGYTANGQELKGAVKTLVVNESSKYQPLEGNGYTGYLNFSVGRQTRISNRLVLSIEPFFKLPIGSLQNQEMNMTNGGIRIVTGF